VQAKRAVPSQVPPQAEPSEVQAARPPSGVPVTGAHVPTEPATAQASHCPSQAALQHTPSTQKPLAHWTAAPQLPPSGAFGAQRPPEHQLAAAQSPSVEQVPRQAVAPQA
jgi:hypothetical protein